MQPNKPNQNNFSPYQQPIYPPPYQQPVLINSQNQLYVAIPINQLAMINGNLFPQKVNQPALQFTKSPNISNEAVVKQEANAQNNGNQNDQEKERQIPSQRKIPKVKHKVNYFDISMAPLITSSKYNEIYGVDSKKPQFQKKKQNQLECPEQDDDQFIIFRNRRVKKKFKCFMTEEDMRIYQQNQAHQSFDEDDEELSISSQNEEVSEKEEQEEVSNPWNARRLRSRKSQKKTQQKLESSSVCEEKSEQQESFKYDQFE